MRGFSKVVVIGNLTRDIEMRTTPSGAVVGSFSVAVNRTYKNASGANQEEVSFIDCSVWGRPAEVMSQYLHKGSPVLISGRLSQHSWDDKNTGQKRSRTEVVVEDFQFLGQRSDSDSSSGRSVAYGGSEQSGSTSTSESFVDPNGENIPGDMPDNLDEINIEDVPF